MKAYRLMHWGGDIQMCDIAVPEPHAGEVLLKVAGNGICRSDLHVIHDWKASPPHIDVELPQTLGHEICGWIEALGPGVTGVERGHACLVTLAGCGHCRYCVEGWNNHCLNNKKNPGMGMDGGLAEYVVVPVGGLVPFQASEPWRLAPLTDAGLSSYHGVKRVLPLLTPGSTVVVIGIGGLGHLAIEALRAISAARIIAVDRAQPGLDLAKKLGADQCVIADDTAAVAIKDSTPGGQVDAALDYVGSGDTIRLAAQVIRPMGHIVIVGRGPGVFEFKDRAMPYGAILSTTFGGSKRELMELVALAEAGKIAANVERFPLSRAQDALDRLQRGEIVGRAVVVPD